MAYLYCLSTLQTYRQHRAGVEKVHIHIVLLNESFVELFAVKTNILILLGNLIFRQINKLILNCLNLVFIFCSFIVLVIAFSLYGLVLMISVISLPPCRFNLLLNGLNDLGSDIF